jgi:hypothetical protein
MRFCPLRRLGLTAVSIAVSIILATTSSSQSCGQDNPLRLTPPTDSSAKNLNDANARDANARDEGSEDAGSEDAVSEDAGSEDAGQRSERQLAERIASICGQHVGPWLQWLTLAAHRPDADPIALQESESVNRIIEIPESTLQAIETQEQADRRDEAQGVCGADEEKGSLEITNDSETDASSEGAADSMRIGESDSDPIAIEIAEPAAPSAIVSRESSGRNVRTPRQLKEMDDPESAPRNLSESMKSKIEEAKSKRNLKSSDEDMRDYLAQEEPTADSVRNSMNDQLQGVDADRAAKPEVQDALGDGITRAPPKSSSKPDRLRTDIPATTQQRLQRIQACLDHYLRNPETTTSRSPWAVMHALLPYGADYELIGTNGRVNAIGWMCHNGLCRTQRIFTPRGDSFVPNVGGGVQGHQGQFLAILAQCQVPLDYPIQIGSKKFTVEDLVRYEMATCKERSELTFKLIGLSYYVDADKQWRSNDGKVWNLEKLVREELAQPVIGSACGGTHRLMGLSFSLRQRELQGKPINGQFARAAQFINEYVRYTWQLQNPDGSFSTNWYQGRANEPNEERKVQTSGHMLEWLMFTVSDEELTSARVEKAVDFLLSKIHDRREHKWPIGPRGHATRALALYNLRIEALLEQRSGGLADSVAKVRVPLLDPAKTTFTTPPPAASVRPPQAAPPGRPANPPAKRSTSQPNRRVRG